MIRSAMIWLVVLVAAACSQGQSNGKNVQATTTSEAQTIADDGWHRPGRGGGAPDKQEAVEANFELQSVGGQTREVLPGERMCVDESPTERTCLGIGDVLYPGSGSLFLDVTITLKNLGSEPSSVSAGGLIASFGGRDFRYALIEREQENTAKIPPLGTKTIQAQYEVPIEVLNKGTFGIDLGSGKPIAFEFETPQAQEDRKASARAIAAARAEEERARDRDEEALHEKCWGLNDSGAPMVTREEFEWYVENCSHMYDVGEYETYLKVKRSRS